MLGRVKSQHTRTSHSYTHHTHTHTHIQPALLLSGLALLKDEPFFLCFLVLLSPSLSL